MIKALVTIPLFFAVWLTCSVGGAFTASFLFHHIDEFSFISGFAVGALVGLPAAFFAIGYLWRE
ncbi:hypothetical protein [Bosea sp. 685]|uniref:hypothetical protein n=1 Tax=Bosea sp. 685 TaxID=3080057 RepID=UPI002892D0A2|nr:hypothetical protein [Bosea sp. 685]WNJ89237.1 hypothetical protein RMR04_22880 [Bosea sp. 685]